MTRTSPQERRYQKLVREQMAFAERAHRRQMVGNVATSFFQSLAANRPLQVGMAIGLHRAGRGIEGLVKGEEKGWAKAFDDASGFAIDAGLAAYLANSDGGMSVAYDIPDVESPKGGDAFGAAGGWFLPPAAAVASRPARSRRG